MAKKPARFRVDPKLASLLGEGYRSSEEALRELVDNAWDADAATVSIQLPAPLESSPIVIEDDGTGMTEQEVREEYLRIASDRRSRKGERTSHRNRRVRGRKGIGKFAGLMAAAEMKVETWARGTLTCVVITKADLAAAREATADLETVDLPVTTEKIDGGKHGTRITLTALNQRFEVPNAEKLRSLLVMEYGREDSFKIRVDESLVALADVPGKRFEELLDIPGVGPVKVHFTVSEQNKPLKNSGLAIRVGGKLVGRPSSIGLEDDELLPPKLLKRVYGEIEADGLAEHVTADWGAIVENSLPFREIQQKAATIVKGAIETTFRNETNLAKARWQKELKRRLEALPENRRRHAEELIGKLLRKLYGEAEEKVEAIVSVALDAFEHDDYWLVLKQIDDATRADVGRLAEALGELGLVDVALVAKQASRRLVFLDEFDALISNAGTLEKAAHQAIENNLWLLGPTYRLIASNKTLANLISNWLQKRFTGKRAQKRPDLLLAALGGDRLLLIEFKRPSHPITRDDETQAANYRDDIQPLVPDKKIEILVVGGSRAVNVSPHYMTSDLRVTSYLVLAAQARDDLGWLVAQLTAG